VVSVYRLPFDSCGDTHELAKLPVLQKRPEATTHVSHRVVGTNSAQRWILKTLMVPMLLGFSGNSNSASRRRSTRNRVRNGVFVFSKPVGNVREPITAALATFIAFAFSISFLARESNLSRSGGNGRLPASGSQPNTGSMRLRSETSSRTDGDLLNRVGFAHCLPIQTQPSTLGIVAEIV
jgi:hypothetical protein